eukprot:1154279-Pelagomonas_calceolata.AAC.14
MVKRKPTCSGAVQTNRVSKRTKGSRASQRQSSRLRMRLAPTSNDSDIGLLVLDFLQALLISIIGDLHALKAQAAASVRPHKSVSAALFRALGDAHTDGAHLQASPKLKITREMEKCDVCMECAEGLNLLITARYSYRNVTRVGADWLGARSRLRGRHLLAA